MKRQVTASSMSEEFLKWHDDENNYHQHPEDYDKVYTILNKYGDESESVDEVFEKASYEDQREMLRLIKPKKQDAQYGTIEYVISNYHAAHAHDLYEPAYADGWADAVDALIDAGVFSSDLVKKFKKNPRNL